MSVCLKPDEPQSPNSQESALYQTSDNNDTTNEIFTQRQGGAEREGERDRYQSQAVTSRLGGGERHKLKDSLLHLNCGYLE